MKITVPTQVLLEAVGHGASVAASKSPKPVLECLVLRASKASGLTLEATDLDVGIRLQVDGAEIEEEGTLVVPAARLQSVIREVEDETITLDEEDGNLRIDTDRSHFRIRGEDQESCPELPTFPGGKVLILAGPMLRSMIRRTVFATAKEAGRYALHGVLFRLSGDTLELVATDGRRLARTTKKLDNAEHRDLKVIVGPKGLSLLDRIMASDASEVAVALEERQVLFRIGHALVISRLIDGTFPAYEDVIPKETKKSFSLPVSELAGALRKAALLASRDAMSVALDIDPGVLTIRSRAPEVGEARVEVPIEYEGPSEQLGFNPTFLADPLKVMEPSDPVRFEFDNGKAPGKITDDEDYVYVVMPIALE
ncbi:MAG: DNA polymerase III subunit beta [Planctomycetota bacterium]|jgi:DNA polymerase-3 subunit beta